MADNPFSPIPLGPYNANPPPDDGSQTEDNKVKWSTIKEKLTDPTATNWDALNNNISSAFGKTINTDADQNNVVQGGLAYTPKTFTISNDSITPTRRHILIAPESGNSDTLSNMLLTNLSDGSEIIVRLANPGDTITFAHQSGGDGQLYMAGGSDFALNDAAGTIQFQRRGTAWYEISPPVSGQVAKAWAKFNGSGTISASYGVSSVTVQTSSQFVVNWSTPFSSVNYAVVAEAELIGTTICTQILNGSQTVSSIVISTSSVASAIGTPPANVHVVAFGDQ